jgi:hypothetical protein
MNMDPKQNDSKRNEEETIQDVSAEEADKVAGGGWIWADTNEPEPTPPTNDGQMSSI